MVVGDSAAALGRLFDPGRYVDADRGSVFECDTGAISTPHGHIVTERGIFNGRVLRMLA